MAITITQEPNKYTAIGSNMMLVALSTNVGNDGFRYVVTVSFSGGAESQQFIVPPNPAGYLMFNPRQAIRYNLRNQDTLNTAPNPLRSIHWPYTNVYYREYANASFMIPSLYSPIGIVINEGYNIDGVFTIDTSFANSAEMNFGCYNTQLDYSYPVNYDLSLLYGNNDGANSTMMTDRRETTTQWDMASSVIGDVNDPEDHFVYIPTRNTDAGVLTSMADNSGDGGTTQGSILQMTMFPSSGFPIISELTLGNAIGTPIHIQAFPVNLNQCIEPEVLKPADYPNWKCYVIRLLDGAGDPVTKSYVFFNSELYLGCDTYDIIRLGWVGRSGGWEYWNFNKKSEESYTNEKVIAQRVVGDTSGSSYDVNSWSESEFIVDMKIQKFITANSDWLSEGEFEYIKGLFLSKQVHWVQDDGSHIPVILEANGYEVKRQFTQGKLYNQQIKFKIAQEQFN